jgi:hypothetical protein
MFMNLASGLKKVISEYKCSKIAQKAAMGRRVPVTLLAYWSDYKKYAYYYFVKISCFVSGTDKKVPDPVRDDPRVVITKIRLLLFCKNILDFWQARIRRFRILSEMIPDARHWLAQPWTNFYKSKVKAIP